MDPVERAHSMFSNRLRFGAKNDLDILDERANLRQQYEKFASRLSAIGADDFRGNTERGVGRRRWSVSRARC
jgi:hypothetical protein